MYILIIERYDVVDITESIFWTILIILLSLGDEIATQSGSHQTLW